MEKSSKNLVIIPAKNEEKKILHTISLLPKGNDYVIVNDNSTDNTEKLLIKNNLNYINLIEHGYDSAINYGIKFALQKNYSKIITFDADGELPSDKINLFFSELQNNQIAIGYRNKMSISEKLFSLITRILLRI